MSQTSMREDRLVLVNPEHGPLLRRVAWWDRLVAIFIDPDLVAIILFCALGGLLTVALVHPLPGWLEVIAPGHRFLGRREPYRQHRHDVAAAVARLFPP